jgi:hypothetical protein
VIPVLHLFLSMLPYKKKGLLPKQNQGAVIPYVLHEIRTSVLGMDYSVSITRNPPSADYVCDPGLSCSFMILPKKYSYRKESSFCFLTPNERRLPFAPTLILLLFPLAYSLLHYRPLKPQPRFEAGPKSVIGYGYLILAESEV